MRIFTIRDIFSNLALTVRIIRGVLLLRIIRIISRMNIFPNLRIIKNDVFSNLALTARIIRKKGTVPNPAFSARIITVNDLFPNLPLTARIYNQNKEYLS